MPLEERREDLLERGLELFTSRAYDEVSLEDFAAAAGVSKGLVYHYFPGKRDLYVATLRLAASRLLTRTEPDLALPKALRLHQGLTAYMDYVEGFAKSYVALLKGGIGYDAEAAEVVDEVRRVIADRVLTALGVPTTDVPPALRFALRGWVGFVEATSVDWLATRGSGAGLSKEALLHMWVAELASSLNIAQGVDPRVKIDLNG
ncbi:MAG: TetR/AcrR family transcriptional regulator [Polyangiaceae bacterium]